MEHEKPEKRDHELENLDDFGKVRFDPDSLASTPKEQAELDAERYYQSRYDKPSAKRAPAGAGNPETPHGDGSGSKLSPIEADEERRWEWTTQGIVRQRRKPRPVSTQSNKPPSLSNV